MSAEDRAFLEEVMKNGIIDEGDRMKEILQQLATAMESYQQLHQQNDDDDDAEATTSTTPDLPHFLELCEELRDICEQIDYARAFMSLQGLTFLLGAIQQTSVLPQQLREAFLGILATCCQNNPPVQMELLEKGALSTLSDLFFVEDTPTKMRAKIVQAMSATIRNHAVGEQVFEALPQATLVIQQGLLEEVQTPNTTAGNDVDASQQASTSSRQQQQQLQMRTLFLLRAFVTSDTSNQCRVAKFQTCIA